MSAGCIIRVIVLALSLWIPTMGAWSAEIRLPEDFDTLQDAIDHAENGDTILVGDGVWTGSNNRDVDFGRKRIHVRSVNGPANCIIDCEGQGIGFFVRGGQRPGESSIMGFTIRNGHTYGLGGALHIWHSAVRIEGNVILDCSASFGGAIFIGDNSRPPIVGNIFSGNCASVGGGAINTTLENLTIDSIIFIGNRAPEGGALSLGGANPILRNNLLAWNEAEKGGAVFCHDDAAVTISHCTITGNTAGQGGAVYTDGTSSAFLDHSILWGNAPNELVAAGASPTVSWSDIAGGFAGSGVIDADPLFVTGPLGPFYLSQRSAGQAMTSPCVNTGSPNVPPTSGTTRTDVQPDTGIIDLGYHHRFSGSPWGPPDTRIESGPWGTVTVPAVSFLWSGSDDLDRPGQLSYAVQVADGEWSSFTGATSIRLTGLAEGEHTVRFRARDSHGNEDPTPAGRSFTVEPWSPGPGWGPVAVVPGPGPVNGPVVRTSAAQWLAYGTLGHGLNIASGDLDGDGFDEIVTGPGPGTLLGAHVRAWDVGSGGVSQMPGISFLAYTSRYGVELACGDIDDDGMDEILTLPGPQPGAAAHLRSWNADGGAVSPSTLDSIAFDNWMGYGGRAAVVAGP